VDTEVDAEPSKVAARGALPDAGVALSAAVAAGTARAATVAGLDAALVDGLVVGVVGGLVVAVVVGVGEGAAPAAPATPTKQRLATMVTVAKVETERLNRRRVDMEDLLLVMVSLKWEPVVVMSAPALHAVVVGREGVGWVDPDHGQHSAH
jgi:hypothetical protein